MDFTAMAGWLIGMVRRRADGGAPEIDAADMGTAYGLEASMLDFEPSDDPGTAADTRTPQSMWRG